MSQSDRAIKKLATQLARLDREVKSWRGAQADYTSIEAGTMDINDSDGNLVSRVGFQDDGSGAVRFFDGPTPPVPSGVTASADGPIIQATWDGTFQDGAEATYDLAYLEVAATLVDDASNVSFATITAKEGASASVVADVTGDWVVAVRSVSQAGKKSEFATAGTVEVKITDVAGAIEAVQDSANGKNKVTYSSHAPTENDPGIFDDTWFVGQVGRPEDIIEGRNLARNPGAHPDGTPWGWSGGSGVVAEMSSHTRGGLDVARATYLSGSSYLYLTSVADYSDPNNVAPVTPGDVISARMLVASSVERSVALRIGFRTASGDFAAWSSIGPYVSVPADGDLVELKIEAQTVPSNAAYAYVHTTSAPGVGTWIEGTRAMFEVSPTVSTYFDGDTPSGATDNESHYRWTGTPHASTSEKYLPALDIGESSNWNIIEQYRHDGSGWVPVELSHHVFSTVDLGKATVGELDGIRIRANTIGAETLTADAIDGKVITGATIRSAASGARTLMSTSGFEAYDNSGKRTFFASASTGNVSMTGELYTGEPGSERVVLDNSLWNSVQITDPDTGGVTNGPGAGVRIGVSSSAGADIYHAAIMSSSGRYIDQAVLRGPSGRARTIYGSASAGGGHPAGNYVSSIVSDDSGKLAAEYLVTVGGHGSSTRKVELIGSDTNGNSRALIRASGGSGISNMWGLDENGVETSEVGSDGAKRLAWIGGKDSSGELAAFVASYGKVGITELHGSNQRPLNINHTGGSDWWFVPFRKSGTEWGYVGSTGAMGVDDFGIQSASGKNLVLKSSGDITYNGARHIADYNSTTGTANVRLTPGNFLGVVSSSRRYKDAIEPATETVGGLVEKMLSVDARTWFDKNSAERLAKALTETYNDEEPTDDLKDVEPIRRIPGVIAEELHDAGLGILVEYNDAGLPESVMYDRLGAMLLPVVRDLRDRITELERQTNG